MEKKNTGLKVTIVILLLLLICSVGYIGYDKFLKKEDVKEPEKINDSEKYQQYLSDLKANIDQFTKTNTNSDNEEFNNSIELSTNLFDDSETQAYFELSNGTLTMSFNNYSTDYLNDEMFKGKELFSADTILSNNVVNAFAVEYGIGDTHKIYFITSSGELKSISIEDSLYNGLKIVNEKNNNIIEVKSGFFTSDGRGSSTGPIFIDINGDIFNEAGEKIR